MKAKNLVVFSWGLTVLVIGLAFIAWGQGNFWEFSGMSTYQIFPLLGLVAFSVMWSHYIVAALRLNLGIEKSATKSYFEATSFIVLLAILLHPGLLAWQRWRDGFGLPPGSELNYLGYKLMPYILIAMTAWLIFLAYEFRRFFGQKAWWKYVAHASDAAMILILIHSLKVGSQLQSGWFHTVWLFYGATLIISLAVIYYKKLAKPEQHQLHN